MQRLGLRTTAQLGCALLALVLLMGMAGTGRSATPTPLPLQLQLDASRQQMRPGQYVTFNFTVINPTNRRVGLNMRPSLRFSTGKLVSYNPFSPQVVSVSGRKVSWQLQGRFPAFTNVTYSITVKIGKGNNADRVCAYPGLTSQDGRRPRLPPVVCTVIN